MRRETQNLVLLLIGVSLVMAIVTGSYTRYVKPGMLPWLIGSAATLIGLALVAMASDIRGKAPTARDTITPASVTVCSGCWCYPS